MNPTECPSGKELGDFLLGRGSPALQEKCSRHIDSCRACQKWIEEHEEDADPLLASLRGAMRADHAPADPLLETLMARAKKSPASEASPASSPEPLRRIGDYELMRKLGEGGFGVVYLARNRYLDRLAAVKVLANSHATSKARFLREMQAIGRLPAHANVVSAWQASEVEGMLYLVMEYVDGCDVSRILRQHGPLTIADACETARQAALALDHIQKHGLVHRDLKPGNLMVTTAGTVKLLDLGLASLVGVESSPSGPTETGMVLGTLDYLSPEQADDPRQADIRADLYSLGCSLYALLVGRPPFADAPRLAKLEAHRRQTPAALRSLRGDIPAALDSLIAKLLEKRPEDRFSTPMELADALTPFCQGANLAGLVQRADGADEGVRAGNPPVAFPKEPTTRTYRSAPRRWPLVALAMSICVALLALGFWLGIRSRHEPQRPEAATYAPARVAVFAEGDGPGWALALAAEGDRAAGITADRRRVYLLDLRSRDPAKIWEHGGLGLAHPNVVFFRRDNRLALGVHTQPNEARLKLYQLPSAELLADQELKLTTVTSLAVSSDGSWLAAAEMGGRIRLFDGPTLKPAPGPPVNPGVAARCVAFSPDAKQIWAACADGFIHGLTRNGTAIHSWKAHDVRPEETDGIVALTIRADGRQILSACLADQLLRRWTLLDGEKAGAISVKQFAASMSCAAFASDGIHAATGHADGEVLIWDLDTPRVLSRHRVHRGPVAAVAITPDGRQILSAGAEDRNVWQYR